MLYIYIYIYIGPLIATASNLIAMASNLHLRKESVLDVPSEKKMKSKLYRREEKGDSISKGSVYGRGCDRCHPQFGL